MEAILAAILKMAAILKIGDGSIAEIEQKWLFKKHANIVAFITK
jgi:hypothetical protein